jgi:hypothetical protein
MGSIPSFLTNSQLEIAKGKLSGHSPVSVIGYAFNIGGSAYKDVWEVDGDLIHATAGESWEVVSDDPNDTGGGSGANAVFVRYLNDQYIEQPPAIVPLTGTTPAPMGSITDAFRFIQMGTAAGNSQKGNITIRVAGGGDIRGRMIIDPLDGSGYNVSHDSHFTIPAGMSALTQLVFNAVPKNADIDFVQEVRAFGTNWWVNVGSVCTYQDLLNVDFSLGAIPVPEKSDIRFRARSCGDTDSAFVRQGTFYLLYDNQKA